MVIDFFKENKIHQVFTHPYTPEENGHVESFHKTLGNAIKKDCFADLPGFERRLEQFYKIYNNDRSHSGISGIPPAKFWRLNEIDKIEIIHLEKKRQKFRLKVAYQDILTLPDIEKYKYREIRA